MAEQPKTSAGISRQPVVYQIRLQGHLVQRWAGWFQGMSIELEEGGDTLLTGPVVDQAALHGILRSIRDLNMSLISLFRLDEDPSAMSQEDEQTKGRTPCVPASHKP